MLPRRVIRFAERTATLLRDQNPKFSANLIVRKNMLGDVFDPNADLFVSEGMRPHWSQAGAIVFVTFRTHDSIPNDVVNRWQREKNDWMRRNGFSKNRDWIDVLPKLCKQDQDRFLRHFNRVREKCLDDCHGRCLLRRPELSKIVADSLLYFDGQRYRMGDFVVMPNHVHLLAAFSSPETMRTQFDSWLHYTACKINRIINDSGHFWQQEPFDHLVRSVEQYEYLRKYIADNPAKATLRNGEFHYQCHRR